jgi:hypothetical protein
LLGGNVVENEESFKLYYWKLLGLLSLIFVEILGFDRNGKKSRDLSKFFLEKFPTKVHSSKFF